MAEIFADVSDFNFNICLSVSVLLLTLLYGE